MRSVFGTLIVGMALLMVGCASDTAQDIRTEENLVGSVVVPMSLDEIEGNLQQYHLRCKNLIGTMERDVSDERRAYSPLMWEINGQTEWIPMYTEFEEMSSGDSTVVTTWIKYGTWERHVSKIRAALYNPEQCVT